MGGSGPCTQSMHKGQGFAAAIRVWIWPVGICRMSFSCSLSLLSYLFSAMSWIYKCPPKQYQIHWAWTNIISGYHLCYRTKSLQPWQAVLWHSGALSKMQYANVLTCWGHEKGHIISKIMRIHPPGTFWNICSEFHGNPSTTCQHILLWTADVSLMLALEVQSGDQHNQWV